MKLHFENLYITISDVQTSLSPVSNTPAIRDKWPGLEAVYAGKSLSKEGDRLVHLVLWIDDPQMPMDYEHAVKYAEQVRPDMDSHIPTRHQSITLFKRLRKHFNQDYYHWTLTKTLSGNSAFVQLFGNGSQNFYDLSSKSCVRAVSEIPL